MSQHTERAALAALLRYVERNTCTHEEVHQGGAIWTICNSCGAKWADDEGGFTGFVEPTEFEAARAALASTQAADKSMYAVMPPNAADWLTSAVIPGAASDEWKEGWDACRNWVTMQVRDQEAASTQAEHCMCPACKDGVLHASDCSVHNMPAYPNGPCDCTQADSEPMRWQLVPTEPTEAMRFAAERAGVPDENDEEAGHYFPFSAEHIAVAYRAMLAVAPRSSSQAVPDLQALADKVVISNATGSEDLFLNAVKELLAGVRALGQAVAGQEDETPSVEVWHGERKVTIYVGENVLRIWGPNTNAEMSEEPYSLKSVGDAMDWLYAPVAGQEQAPVGARDIIEMLCNGLEWNIENAPEVMGQADDEALAQARAWLAAHPQGVGAAEPEGAMEMALCESISMVLREGQLYRFVKVGDCEKCAAMSAASFKAYGLATNTQAEGQP